MQLARFVAEQQTSRLHFTAEPLRATTYGGRNFGGEIRPPSCLERRRVNCSSTHFSGTKSITLTNPKESAVRTTHSRHHASLSGTRPQPNARIPRINQNKKKKRKRTRRTIFPLIEVPASAKPQVPHLPDASSSKAQKRTLQ